MKKILMFFIVYLLVLTCSNSKSVKLPDKNLEIKDSIVYYKNELFTGEVTGIDNSNNSARFKAQIKNGIVEGKVELLASDIDFLYSISNGRLNGEISILDIVLLYKDDVIQKCYPNTSFMTQDIADSFCKITKENPDGESFPTTGKELQKRTLNIIKRLNN
jgi:hypothetical protein